jgi:LuxR family maltose regulon positive regulatory protein
MDTSILAIKLFIPPTRPELVARPRLYNKFFEGLHHKLTLICAPAGFGKTTLVTEWLDSIKSDIKNGYKTDLNIAWLSLDRDDNDLVRFLSYVITSLNQIEGIETTLGKGALSMLQSPQPPPTETILSSLINDITAISNRIILVLDDYHLIETQPNHDALTYLLDHLPPQLHLVIATREDPYIPLARLRSLDQLTEMRAADLRFTSSEATEFLNQAMGLDLSAKNITALQNRTEGWVAGLQLAAISLQGHAGASSLIESFTGSHRFVLDYLIEEVLNQQSENIQTFLLETAILDRLTGSLCDALTGQDNGQKTLEILDRANLFIVPLDNERRWYRYHHLFVDLLRQRLGQTQPDQLPELHLRASKWYEQQGFTSEAIDHTLSGEDYNRAAELIGTHLDDKYEKVAPLTLQRWFAVIPVELIETQPQLMLLQAWSQFNSGQLESADQSLQGVGQLLDTDVQLSNSVRDALYGRTAAIQSFIASYRGDLPGTIQFAKQALDVLPDAEQSWRSMAAITLGDVYAAQGQMLAAHQIRTKALALSQSSGDPYVLMIANLNLAETLFLQGQLPAVIENCERLMQITADHNMAEAPIVGWLLGLWGGTLAELNQLDRALELTQKGVELAEHSQDMTYISSSNLHRVRVLFSAGNLLDAQAFLQGMVHAYTFPLRATTQISAWQARIWVAQGNILAAAQWLAERNLNLDGELPFVHEPEYVAMARVLLAKERWDEAVELMNTILKAAETGGRKSRMIEILLLQALAFQTRGDTDEAMVPLGIALTFAEPGGFIRIFVDEGPPMAQLLYEALKHGNSPEYINLLLAAFPVAEPDQTDQLKALAPKSGLVEPLSERELEVLQLIAEGLTNQEISSRFFISIHTVKTHTRNIYAKFNVNSRTQAVAKARALGLLSEI